MSVFLWRNHVKITDRKKSGERAGAGKAIELTNGAVKGGVVKTIHGLIGARQTGVQYGLWIAGSVLAGGWVGVKQRHVKTGFCKQIRSGDAGDTGTNDSDALSGDAWERWCVGWRGGWRKNTVQHVSFVAVAFRARHVKTNGG